MTDLDLIVAKDNAKMLANRVIELYSDYIEVNEISKFDDKNHYVWVYNQLDEYLNNYIDLCRTERDISAITDKINGFKADIETRYKAQKGLMKPLVELDHYIDIVQAEFYWYLDNNNIDLLTQEEHPMVKKYWELQEVGRKTADCDSLEEIQAVRTKVDEIRKMIK